MLGATVAILLCLLSSQANALITTDAKCLSGYAWMFSSIGQSPCDVAAELGAVCVGGQFNLAPLNIGYIYVGPTQTNQNGCRCSSVYYSLLSGCAYCQGRDYLRWSTYNRNCSLVHLTVYNQSIPVGVKVPAYAYLNVSISDGFNVTLAQSVRGAESSHLPSSGTPVPMPTLGSSSSPARSDTPNNTPAIIGGVVGGVIGLGLIVAFIIFLVLRSKKKPKPQNYNSGFPRSPNMAFTPNTTPSYIRSTTSPLPGSPGMVYNVTGQSTYPFPDPRTYDPHRQHASPVNQNVMLNSAQHYVPQTMPENTGNVTGQSTYPFPDPRTYDPHRQHSSPVNQNVMLNSAQHYVPQTMPENTGVRSSYYI